MTLSLSAPLAGWCAPLEEVPDEVFATRMLGDGVALDPVSSVLCAPCDGEVILLAATRHALTLRTTEGAEILMHVGLETVALGGTGFAPAVSQGQRVRRGDALLRFDLDLLARRARSLLTPVIVNADGRWRIARRALACEVAVGDFLMELEPSGAAAAPAAPGGTPAIGRRLTLALVHGLHARPAALVATALGPFDAEVRVQRGERSANARSTVALMALGARHGEVLELEARGADA
ncbi:MAG TPA: glucose PTS transporter subunit IIA, partial [Steroidobacteraceae bacterium]|nr:glucose PTS transporter subunit IIA [Steroidobacteraceae bacterium]